MAHHSYAAMGPTKKDSVAGLAPHTFLKKFKPYEKIHQDLRLDSRWSHSERLCEPLAPMMGRFTYRRVLDNDK